MSTFLFGSDAKEMFSMLVVILCADTVASRNLDLGKSKVLLMSIQQALPRSSVTARDTSNMFDFHETSNHDSTLLFALGSMTTLLKSETAVSTFACRAPAWTGEECLDPGTTRWGGMEPLR
jgi:hypothetical protein